MYFKSIYYINYQNSSNHLKKIVQIILNFRYIQLRTFTRKLLLKKSVTCSV
jgi:hypothetical protein